MSQKPQLIYYCQSCNSSATFYKNWNIIDDVKVAHERKIDDARMTAYQNDHWDQNE